MKLNKIAPFTLASSLLIGGLNVSACDEIQAGTPFEELDRHGVELNHYIVDKVYTTGYRATGADGSVIRFKNDDVEVKLVRGDRIRTFTQDSDFLSAEKVNPDIVKYKVIGKFKSDGKWYWTGESKSEGLIQFSEDDTFDINISTNDSIIAEFDTMYIEDGLIVVYKVGK